MIEWDEVKDVSVSKEVVDLAIGYLRKTWPGGQIEQASHDYDLLGADFIASHPLSEIRYYIDLKYRRTNPKYKRFAMGCAVEWWSKLPDKKQEGVLGWSLATNKITTHILYMFEDRAYLIDFKAMQKLIADNAAQFKRRYGSYVNTTVNSTGHSWSSEVSFVFASEFDSAIVARF